VVAEEDDVLVGFVACGPAHDAESLRNNEWEIHNLHVAPTRHGQGIGSALFESAVRLGRERGAAALMLWVVRTNTDARAFYERRGMLHDGGEQEHSIAPGLVLHEVRYKMALPGGAGATLGHHLQ
jgi:ribosomal protein S18 acetylase RimI-like enzyme